MSFNSRITRTSDDLTDVLFFLYMQTVLRVWDCLFYEGSKVLFRVALTLIIHHQTEILRARSLPDVCKCFKDITCGSFTLDCHTFMQVRTIGHQTETSEETVPVTSVQLKILISKAAVLAILHCHANQLIQSTVQQQERKWCNRYIKSDVKSANETKIRQKRTNIHPFLRNMTN